jgi:hypothetical protein
VVVVELVVEVVEEDEVDGAAVVVGGRVVAGVEVVVLLGATSLSPHDTNVTQIIRKATTPVGVRKRFTFHLPVTTSVPPHRDRCQRRQIGIGSAGTVRAWCEAQAAVLYRTSRLR